MVSEAVALRVLERWWPGDALVRWGIRRLNLKRLGELERGGVEAQTERKLALVRALCESPTVVHSDLANQQHYELPTEFFKCVLGKNLKYSGCLWTGTTLDAAEDAMLALYAERAGLADGQRILDLGCGWGSLTLWMARRFPNARILAISNSRTQRQHIESYRLDNVEVRTVNVAELDLPAGSFDRIVSVEMLEHVRNYRQVFGLLQRALRPGGKLFIHVFAHARHPYLFELNGGRGDWMERHFFAGGVMPSLDLFLYFADGFRVEGQWAVNGRHYERTALAWLERMRARRTAVLPILRQVYGRDWRRWWVAWQLFFLACAELFGHANGEEWLVHHLLLTRECER